MPAHLELWLPGGPRLVPLEGDRLGLGREEGNSLVLQDASVSRRHARLERFEAGWLIRDLSSSNGTFVNGERVIGEKPIYDGDELRLGESRLVFWQRGDDRSTVERTASADAPPRLTPREREVLEALCRGGHGQLFRRAPSVRELAAELVVTEAAIKQHLTHLYDKFGLQDGPDRRIRLADEAVRRRAVSLGAPRRDPETRA